MDRGAGWRRSVAWDKFCKILLEDLFFELQSIFLHARLKTLHAGVAQLVEQLICNQRVGGSNPLASSSNEGRKSK